MAPASSPAAIRIRTYAVADVPGLTRIQSECFPPPFPESLWWTAGQIEAHVRTFPEGALCAEVMMPDGSTELVASATAHRVRIDLADLDHTWAEMTADGWLTNHDPAGDTLYGVDIAVRPAWRGRGVARALYEARFALVRRLGLRRLLCGSRLSGYHRHRDRLSPEAYAAEVVAGRLADPVVTPQLRLGLRPLQVVRGYLPDADSADCALLMAWNPEQP